jgi:hypothetical protein
VIFLENGKKKKHLRNNKENIKPLKSKLKRKKQKSIKKESELQNLKLKKRLTFLEYTTLEDQT